MNATTLIHACQRPAAEILNLPRVMRAGVFDPMLSVTRLSSTSPLDRREVSLSHVSEHDANLNDYLNEWHDIVWPYERWDGEGKLLCWSRGQLVHHARDSHGHDVLHLEDAWSRQLDRSLSELIADASVRLNVSLASQIRVGLNENASTQTMSFNGSSVHIPEPSTTGHAWTIAAVLDWLNALGELQLDRTALGSISSQRLRDTLEMTSTMGETLQAFCNMHNLVIMRQFDGDTNDFRHGEYRAVVPRQQAPIGDAPLQCDDPSLINLNQQNRSNKARRWIAYGSRPRVEGSWIMVGGWASQLESETANQYSRSASTDFQTHRDVFRRWVLNEHGGWSSSSFNRGIAVDLAELFEQPELTPQPLRLRSCLTHSENGQSKGIILEASLDSGQTWAAYSGAYELLSQEAGVYLSDDTLDAAFLSAGLGGSLRMRVTATLQSPKPIMQQRWTGNALHGLSPTIRWHAGQDFSLARVDASSLHFDDIRAGNLTADLRDDRYALLLRLDEHIDSDGQDERWAWSLAGLRPWLTSGQRISVDSRHQTRRHLNIQQTVMTVDPSLATAKTQVELLPSERPQT